MRTLLIIILAIITLPAAAQNYIQTQSSPTLPYYNFGIACDKILIAPYYKLQNDFLSGPQNGKIQVDSVTNQLNFMAPTGWKMVLTKEVADTMYSSGPDNVYAAGFGITKTGAEPSATFAVDQTIIMTAQRAADSILAIKNMIATKAKNITLTTAGSVGSATYNSTTGVLNIPVYIPASVGTRTAYSAGSMNFNQAYQITGTNKRISVSARISCTLSLTSGQSGSVILETSPNGTSAWTYAGQIDASNTGTLTVGLNTTQLTGAQLSVDVSAGQFWRMRTSNTTGTPGYLFQGGYEQVIQ